MMTYQQYVKARSAHMKQQGTTLTGSERMKQIASEWNSKGRGIAMAGGGFNDIIRGLQSFLGPPRMSGGELLQEKMVGGGAKLNKLKKYALKYGVPLATAAALVALGSQNMTEPDLRNTMPFELIDEMPATPAMDEDKITGMGLKKKGKKAKFPHNMVKGKRVMVAKNKKQHDALKKMGYMEGEGFFSDIGDSISGFFSDPVEAIKTTAGLTLSALPFIL